MPLWEGKIHPPSLSENLSINQMMMMMRISVSETEILSLSFDRLYLFLKDRDRPVLSQREIDSTSGDDSDKNAGDDVSLLIDTLSPRDSPTLSRREIDFISARWW